MKKLNLKSLDIKISDVLSRNYLKTIFGGYEDEIGEGSCSAECPNGGPLGNGWTVTCQSNSWCNAYDNVGCESDIISQSC